MALLGSFFDKKVNINIKQANILKVVPPKKAGVRYSWSLLAVTSITANMSNVMPDIKPKTIQKPGASKPYFPSVAAPPAVWQ